MIQNILDHFQSVDPVIYPIIAKMDQITLSSRQPNKYFKSLCQNIICQQLSSKAADTIYHRFYVLFPDGITPQNILVKTDMELRAIGMSLPKARYVLDLATKINSGQVKLNHLTSLTNEEVVTELIKVKGIGVWTAEMFLIFTLGREDVFSFGDLGLRNAIKNLYHTDDKTTMDIITTKWSPYRSYASLALWHSLDN